MALSVDASICKGLQIIMAPTHTITHPKFDDWHGRIRTMRSAITGSKQVNPGHFRPGQSGNPAGRPKGARNRSTIAAESLLEGEAEALTRKAIALALAGDTTALRLCIERLVPPRKDRPITFELPPIASAADVANAVAAVLRAVAEGRVTLSEAMAVTSLIEALGRAIPAEPPQISSVGLVRLNFVKSPASKSRPEA